MGARSHDRNSDQVADVLEGVETCALLDNRPVHQSVDLVQQDHSRTDLLQDIHHMISPSIHCGLRRVFLKKGLQQLAVIKGDQRVLPIAAASIVAKVARDKLMKELGIKFPVYQFEKHKGYGTKKHEAALKKFGVSAIHRRSFAPMKQLKK